MLTFISCKKEKDKSNIAAADRQFVKIDTATYKDLVEKANFYNKYFSFDSISTDTINDPISKLMVKRYIRKSDGSIDYLKTRSVFFSLSKLHNIIGTLPSMNYDSLGMRIYFAKYDSQDPGVLSYLQSKYNCGNCTDYLGNNTLVIQIMNGTNDKFIYMDSAKTDLLNFNLGELCPPCSNNTTGLKDDEYIK